MTQTVAKPAKPSPRNELWSVFDARRVKAPELTGLDAAVNGFVGWMKNRVPVLATLKAQAARVELLEPEIQKLSSSKFTEAVDDLRALARRNRLVGDAMDRALAVAREAALLAASACGPSPCRSWAPPQCAGAPSPRWLPAKAKR